jgi:1-hydroxycarotenoid 3,4-desaturase
MPSVTPARQAVVVGAGIGGLACALDLALAGVEVTLLERSGSVGGKLSETRIGAARIDDGPTVFTMRWVFDELFDRAGTTLARKVALTPAVVLARHAWDAETRFDLFADRERTVAAIGTFAGAAEARRYEAFCARAEGIYRTLDRTFLRDSRPTVLELVRRSGVAGLPGLARIAPFATLWSALGNHFHDPRLRQLFGRYATYCGGSPYLAPATLMLVAHVEREGVWLVEGGMQRLARATADLARARGVTIRLDTPVREVLVRDGRAAGVITASGEIVHADAVVLNADVAAVASGHFGKACAKALPAVPRTARSLSAVTFALFARTRGFPLSRHNVFFGADYAREFDELFKRRRLPSEPTVYVCAQDRGAGETLAAPHGAERLLCLVNAPPTGDTHVFGAEEIESCAIRAFGRLAACGLSVDREAARMVSHSPNDFDRRFPASGGALYGAAPHGWQAAFRRPGSRTRLPGLLVAGGSAHPGPGVPMAALSGRLAAQAALEDFDSTARSSRVAMPGGTSTHSPTTDATRSR